MNYQIYYTKSTIARLRNAIGGSYRGYSITYATRETLHAIIERLRECGYAADIYEIADDGTCHFGGRLAK